MCEINYIKKIAVYLLSTMTMISVANFITFAKTQLTNKNLGASPITQNIQETQEDSLFELSTEETDEDVIEINTAEDLIYLSQTVNEGNNLENKTIKLMNNINMGGINFEPIGTSNNTFKGLFDGQKHTIRNLTCINSKQNYVGLFGYVGKGGEVKNVRIIKGVIIGLNFVGGIAGYNEGLITNCTYSGIIDGKENVNINVGLNCGTTSGCDKYEVHNHHFRSSKK